MNLILFTVTDGEVGLSDVDVQADDKNPSQTSRYEGIRIKKNDCDLPK